MSLNSSESEGLRPLHFLPLAPLALLALLAQAGPGHGHLEQPAVVSGGQGELYLLLLRGNLHLHSEEWGGLGLGTALGRLLNGA